MTAYYAEFEPVPADKARPHQRPVAEFLHVLHGRLGLGVAPEDDDREAGDPTCFNSGHPHNCRRFGAKRCSGIVVSVP